MKRKFRVYMFVYLFPPEYTGASIQALNLAKKLREKDVDITFITGTTTKDVTIKKEYEKFRVIRIWHPLNNVNLSLAIYWLSLIFILIRDYRKYDIIHCHGILTYNNILSFIGRLLMKRTLIKSTLSNEVDELADFSKKGREARFNYYAMASFDYIVALSNNIYKSILNACISKKKIILIPNGVNLERFNPPKTIKEKQILRKQLNLPDGLIFSYIGVIHKRKNVAWMIKNWIEYFKDKENVYLLVAGPDSRETIMADGGGKQYVKEIIDLVRRFGAEKKVLFMPFRKKVEDYFKASDYFINPSESEGLSNSLLESMACGVVPLVSRTSGTDDVIIDRYNGYLFNIRSNEEFVNTLAEINDPTNKQKKISQKAIDTITERFSIERTASKYLSLYERLMPE
jgi:glycosyltransferase involved in cell wall biosynthesis